MMNVLHEINLKKTRRQIRTISIQITANFRVKNVCDDVIQDENIYHK
jgi:hypothetical protein